MNAVPTVAKTESKPIQRIESLDQFRGYSVAAMFVVNFVSVYMVTHQLFKHNNTHFSYADSIMPSFLFACGFSYRMSYLKRRERDGLELTNWSFLRRSLALIWLSLMLTAFNPRFETWQAMSVPVALNFFAQLLKANAWEVLAIIGAVQILILPIIGSRAAVRVWAVLLLGLTHVFISWSFNEAFVYGRANWMDNYFGAGGKRAWDGGLFGLISWSQIMLIGSLALDLIQAESGRRATWRLIVMGASLMLLGYGLSCLTRLYDREFHTESIAAADGHAYLPVVPDFSGIAQRPWHTLLAEPPFVPPPPTTERAINYWMMDKRMVTQAFVYFGSGLAMLIYALFVVLCDQGGRTLGLFRTFGQNPLAAYVIHHLVAVAFWAIVPKVAPLLPLLCGLTGYFATTYLFVRYLEQRHLFLRL
ncbi:MAG: hypothetical protein IT423_04940 [Pirellulaceae bacterium]|nr:hypothetical protein [Pirellulaceae bacterium]